MADKVTADIGFEKRYGMGSGPGMVVYSYEPQKLQMVAETGIDYGRKDN